MCQAVYDISPNVLLKQIEIMKLLYYVLSGAQKLHPTEHLFAAQMARECMITCGEGDESMTIVDSDGKIYPNSYNG